MWIMIENNGMDELSIRPQTIGLKAKVEALRLKNLYYLRIYIIGYESLVLIL